MNITEAVLALIIIWRRRILSRSILCKTGFSEITLFRKKDSKYKKYKFDITYHQFVAKVTFGYIEYCKKEDWTAIYF